MNERLLKLCLTNLHQKGLRDEVHKTRLKYELKQLALKEEEEYFLDLHDRKIRYPYNQHNLLTAYLLGVVNDFDINQEAAFEMGEMPDIDVDYIPIVQSYIKNVWAPKQFGERNVCSVGTTTVLGIKSSVLDMTKIYGVDKTQIQAITVNMEDKDDDNKPLEWEKAMQLYPEFAAFCAQHPEIAEASQAMLDRAKSTSVHAGGLIISDQPIDKFVPLEVRKVSKDLPEGVVVSAWSEGLRSQDLQAVGLVKFDALSIINLLQRAYACRLIKERHPEVKSICALPGQRDWTDTAYLNDPKAIELAKKADLRCVFQFDSEGIRRLVKRIGVTSFDDLVAATALYRPGPLQCLQKDSKIKLEHGEKPIEELMNWGEDRIAFLDSKGVCKYTNRFLIWKTGKKKILKITTKSGKVIKCSADHRLLKSDNHYVNAETLKLGEKISIINS